MLIHQAQRAIGLLAIVLVGALHTSIRGQEQDFKATLELAKTPRQLQQLLGQYPDETKRIVPVLEKLLIRDLEAVGLKTRAPRVAGITVQKNRYTGNQKVRVEPVSSGKLPSVLFPPNSRMWLASYMAPTFQHGELTEADSVGSVTLKHDQEFEVILEAWGDRVPPFVLDSTGGVRLTGLSERDVPLGHGSVHRFVGNVALFGHTFMGDGSEADRLTFVLLRNLGYRYLRGNGRVLTKEGREMKVGDNAGLR
jgi:hypothetical protein